MKKTFGFVIMLGLALTLPAAILMIAAQARKGDQRCSFQAARPV